jgi:hypothetical protein
MSATEIILLAIIVVGLPVVLGIMGDVYKRRLRHEERKLELLAGEAAVNAQRQSERADAMEQRLRVLEEIATDQGIQTATQIEALRALRLGARSDADA